MIKKNSSKNNVVSITFILLLLLAALVLLTVPVLKIAEYTIPTADDFSFSIQTHTAFLNGEGLNGMILGALDKTAEVYKTWQGSFTAVFLMAFQPSIWGFRMYRITTYVMVLPLIASVFLLSDRVYSGVFQIRRNLSAVLAAFAAIICTQFLPDAHQGFYWYNASVYYTLTFSVMLSYFSCMIGYLVFGKWWRILLMSLMGIFLGGNNYVTALFSLIILCCTDILLFIRQKKEWKVFLLPLLFLAAAFFVNVLAPGNAVRQGGFPSHPGAIKAIGLSFLYAMRHILNWSNLRLAAGLIAAFPFIRLAATESTRCSFRLPGVVTLVSFCLFSALFTPHAYAIGSAGPGRIQNIYFFAFVILVFFDLFWWCGWFSKSFPREKTSNSSEISVVAFLGCSCAALVCLVCSVMIFHGSITFVMALNEMRSGQAQAFYSQALERQTVLEDPSITDCIFQPYRETPYLLYSDMSDDPTSYQNQDMALYYGKQSIVVRR